MRYWITLCLALSSFCVFAVEQLPSTYFGALPEFSRPMLSPDGKKIAFVRNISEPHHLALLTTYNVAKVKTPTLLVHGKEDRVVHVEQSQLYADELEDYDKSFKYVELESADHYLTMGSNRMRFFEELDAFLATYLQ